MPEKICRICNKQKPEYLFNKAKGNTSGVSNRCKECDILYQKDYRKQNKDKVRKRQYKKRITRKLDAVVYLGGVCSICLKSYPLECYDFHHKNPDEKELVIGEQFFISKERFWKEIDKCILVCSNCHRTLHSKEQHG